jgi:excisionase family DNA binding protein
VQERELTLKEVADRLEVSYALVYRWVRQGRIKAIPPQERGYRVKESDCIRPPSLRKTREGSICPLLEREK